MSSAQFDHEADAAVEALRARFGFADIEHTGGGCFVIWVPIEDLGAITVGDWDGSLSPGGIGFTAVLRDTSREDAQITIVRLLQRDHDLLLRHVTDYLLTGRRVGLTWADLACERRDAHHDATGHLVTSQCAGEPGCARCDTLHRLFLDHDTNSDAAAPQEEIDRPPYQEPRRDQEDGAPCEARPT
jgi:hypothetical protein